MFASRVTLIVIPKIITRIAISTAVTAAGPWAQLRKADLNTTFVQRHKSCRAAHAHARIQRTSPTKSARRLVTHQNGLAMAIAMTRITLVVAIGMVEIAVATTGISNSAHTVCAEIRIINQRNRDYG